jgi:hypothetical protein
MTYYKVEISYIVVAENDYDALLIGNDSFKAYGLSCLKDSKSTPPSLRNSLKVTPYLTDEGKPLDS